MMTKIYRRLASPAVLWATAGLLAGCVTTHQHRAPGVDHVVVVWLKRRGHADDAAQLVATAKELQRQIPELRCMSFGRALPAGRPAVDDTFDLAFVMTFDDRAALETYEQHPAHVRARRDVLRPLSRKVVIYDIARD